MAESDRIMKIEKFGNIELETIYRKARKPLTPEEIAANTTETNFGYCPKINQRTYLAADGILCEQDVPIPLRDGTILYVDIYRPDGAKSIPALISWSFFGKRPNDEWRMMGVPAGTVSEMSKFESPDPGYWCLNGYAVVNVDPRGCGHSQGDSQIFGTSDGKDGYDVIEWLARQHWCSGKVGMSGNSGVAMSQWRVAAEQPPHLACIAPWEGTSDIYRESAFEGGIPGKDFVENIVAFMTGDGYIDDMVAMMDKYPYLNEYWQDKAVKFEKIKVPAYVTASWSHMHLRGSFMGFMKIRSGKKWMRAHREFEWPDAFCYEGIEDLRRFFDRYLKEIHNGWELTPKVRIEVMDAYDFDFQTNRAETEFPLARTDYRKLYLDAANVTDTSHAPFNANEKEGVKDSISSGPVAAEDKVSFDGNTGHANFVYTFEEDTELTGFMKLHLWVQAETHDNLDLFINIQKLDKDGKFLPTSVLGEPHPGAWGKIRASRRELDEKLSTDYQPVLANQRDLKLKPGEIVPLEIEIWPHSRIWYKGEKLRINISGFYKREGWFEPLGWQLDNKGNNLIHTGGRYDSWLQVPVIPPKYVAAGRVYR